MKKKEREYGLGFVQKEKNERKEGNGEERKREKRKRKREEVRNFYRVYRLPINLQTHQTAQKTLTHPTVKKIFH
jgi:hypothetical protein